MSSLQQPQSRAFKKVDGHTLCTARGWAPADALAVHLRSHTNRHCLTGHTHKAGQ
jgi:hypothetical protein